MLTQVGPARDGSSQKMQIFLLIGIGVLIGSLLTVLFTVAPSLHAQATSPLTIRPDTGNVGIGTTGPDKKLVVSSNGPSPLIAVRGTGAYDREFGGITWDIGPDTAVFYSSGVGSDVRIAAGAHNANHVTVKSSGNVGIGTTGPSSKLHVWSGSDTQPVLEVAAWGNMPEVFKAYRGGVGNEDKVLVMKQNGWVGIGTTTPTSRLHVNGTLTATTKNFSIPHPLDPVQKRLVHSALEGPEAAVYYRGEAQLQDREVRVVLPPYFEALTRNEDRTVQLTPIDGWTPLYVVDGVQEGGFTVRTAENGNPTQRFYWEVKAARADVPTLAVEPAKGTQVSFGR